MSISSAHSHPNTPSASYAFSAPLNPDWQHEDQEVNSEEDAEEIEEEEDDEVDQLVDESISDPDETTEEDPPVKDVGRVPGQTLLPAVRLENIMQADGVTQGLSLSREGMFILSIAAEEFIKRLAQGGHREATAEGRSYINYSDMANTTRQYQEFMFLQDIIPAPISLADALEMREAREKEIFNEDPSLSTQPISLVPNHSSLARSFHPNPNLSSLSSASSKPKKSRSTNGKEKVNGTTVPSASSRSESLPHTVIPVGVTVNAGTSINIGPSVRGQWVPPGHGVLDARPWTHWAEPQTGPGGTNVNNHPENHRTTLVVNGSPNRGSTNGHAAPSSTSPPVSRSGTTTGAATPSVPPTSSSPSVPKDSRPESASPVDSNSEQAQFTGSASGYLQGPGGPSPFSRSGANHGRTIYSQQQG